MRTEGQGGTRWLGELAGLHLHLTTSLPPVSTAYQTLRSHALSQNEQEQAGGRALSLFPLMFLHHRNNCRR